MGMGMGMGMGIALWEWEEWESERHSRTPLVPKSTTLHDLERRVQGLHKVFLSTRYYLTNG